MSNNTPAPGSGPSPGQTQQPGNVAPSAAGSAPPTAQNPPLVNVAPPAAGSGPPPGQTPPPGNIGPPAEPSTISPAVASDVAKYRRRWGYGLLTLSVCLVVTTVYLSIKAIDGFTGDKTFDYVRLAVHGAVTIFFVLFCYGLMQTAERLAVPSEWVRTSEDLRLLLGVKTPASIVTREVRNLAKAVAPLIRAAVGSDPKA